MKKRNLCFSKDIIKAQNKWQYIYKKELISEIYKELLPLKKKNIDKQQKKKRQRLEEKSTGERINQ